jgi:outer membrane protein
VEIKFIRIFVMVCLTGSFFIIPGISADQTNAAGPASQKGLTLSDCFKAALKNNETIGIRKDQILEAKAQSLQAWSYVLPHLSYTYTALAQEYDKTTGLPSYVISRNSDQHRFSLNQSLFSGFREYAGLAIVSYEVQIAVAQEAQAEWDLFDRIIDAFYGILEQRGSLSILNDVHEVLQKRMEDIQERISVGRARASDLSTTKVLLYQTEAQIESIKQEEYNMSKLLEYLTGVGTSGTLSDSGIVPESLENEDTYIPRAYSRQDVVAAQKGYEAAKKQVAVSRADLYPGVMLSGDYYPGQTGKFTGPNWDVALSVTLPLLPLVQTAGSIDESKAKFREASKQYDYTLKTALYGVHTAYINLKTVSIRRMAYEKALKSAEENYQLQKDDYTLHLISILDFLQAVQSLQNSRLDYLHVLYDEKRLYGHFKTSLGEFL